MGSTCDERRWNKVVAWAAPSRLGRRVVAGARIRFQRQVGVLRAYGRVISEQSKPSCEMNLKLHCLGHPLTRPIPSPACSDLFSTTIEVLRSALPALLACGPLDVRAE